MERSLVAFDAEIVPKFLRFSLVVFLKFPETALLLGQMWTSGAEATPSLTVQP